MNPDSRSYLDIETSYEQRITVVGIYRPDRDVLQLVGRNVTAEAINDQVPPSEFNTVISELNQARATALELCDDSYR